MHCGPDSELSQLGQHHTETVQRDAHTRDGLTSLESPAPQEMCRFRAMRQCRKRQHLQPQ
ncbi:hypothetical protein BN126360076 [Stenotrophomonas indicatrix]|nr:hypothetical protein BN126360076 [Stenotrophomonas indicatrix]